jgi:Periplasmic binding protein
LPERKVELVNYDDQSSPATVPGIYSKLLDVDKVVLVLSGYGTVPTAAAMPLIMENGKVFLSLFALAASDQFNHDRYFQLQPNGPNAKVGLPPLNPLGLYALCLCGDANPRSRHKGVNTLDDGKLAEYMRKTTFDTVASNIKFGTRGEWTEPRLLLIQYREVQGNDVEQFKQPGKK